MLITTKSQAIKIVNGNNIFKNCNFVGDFSNLNFKNSQFIKCCFNNSNFRNCNFSETTIESCNFLYTNLVFAYFIGSKILDVTFSGANLAYSSFEGSSISNCNFANCNVSFASFMKTRLKRIVISPASFLLAYWGSLSKELTADLMNYDASNHPNPKLFKEWAKGGECPYDGIRILRAANFEQRLEFWDPRRKLKTALELMIRVIKETCYYSDWH